MELRGEFNVPMVLMTTVGSGIHGSIYHSHSIESIATHLPGWKVVYPCTPLDAYGLMISSLKEPNPVMFLECKALLRTKGKERIPGEPEDDKILRDMIDAPLGDRTHWKPRWPELTDFAVPIGKGKLCREGSHATVVSYGRTLPLCVEAADALASEGIRYDVIDLRSLMPFDWEMIAASIRKTGRVLFVNEDTEITNFGEHLLRRAIEEFFYEVQVAPRLLAGKHVPGIGMAPTLEDASVPQGKDILSAMRELAAERPDRRSAPECASAPARGRVHGGVALARGPAQESPRSIDPCSSFLQSPPVSLRPVPSATAFRSTAPSSAPSMRSRRFAAATPTPWIGS